MLVVTQEQGLVSNEVRYTITWEQDLRNPSSLVVQGETRTEKRELTEAKTTLCDTSKVLQHSNEVWHGTLWWMDKRDGAFSRGASISCGDTGGK